MGVPFKYLPYRTRGRGVPRLWNHETRLWEYLIGQGGAAIADALLVAADAREERKHELAERVLLNHGLIVEAKAELDGIFRHYIASAAYGPLSALDMYMLREPRGGWAWALSDKDGLPLPPPHPWMRQRTYAAPRARRAVVRNRLGRAVRAAGL